MNDDWSRLEPILRFGEKLRWSGRPDPAVRFAPADLLMVPVSLMFCGFTVVWEFLAITNDAPWFFALWGIPFMGVGLYFLFGRFIYKKRRKLKTVYALTDERAIILTGDRSVQDIGLKGGPMKTVRSRDGRHASIIFGTGRNAAYQNTGLEFFNRGDQGFAFFDVAEADSLFRELDQVR